MSEEKPLAVKNDGGDVDAITASTITSRAFLKAVNRAFEAYRKIVLKMPLPSIQQQAHRPNTSIINKARFVCVKGWACWCKELILQSKKRHVIIMK